MSSDINTITITGRLGADGELRVTPGGGSVLKLRVACNETWVKDGGQKQERVDWFSAECWGRRAEALAQFMTKGLAVTIEGRLRAEKVGEGNATKYYQTIRINNITFQSGGGESRQKEMPTEPDRRETAPAPAVGAGDLDDSIPF